MIFHGTGWEIGGARCEDSTSARRKPFLNSARTVQDKTTRRQYMIRGNGMGGRLSKLQALSSRQSSVAQARRIRIGGPFTVNSAAVVEGYRWD